MSIVFERAGAALVARVVEIPGLTGCPEEIEFGVECPTEWAARLLLTAITDARANEQATLVREAYEIGYRDGRLRRGRNNPSVAKISLPAVWETPKKTAKTATKKSVARRA